MKELAPLKTNRSFASSRRLFAALALLAAAAPSATRAASIGVSFGASNAYSTLAATDSAGAAPYAQTHFNNVTATTATALQDNSGLATSVSLTLTGSAGLSFISNAATGADEVLNNGVALVNGGGSQTFTLANIPYASYTLVVYGLNLQAGNTQSVAAGGTTYYLSSPNYNAAGYIDGNAATAFTYTQATSTVAAAPTLNSDYAVFTGLSGSALTITDTNISGTYGLVGGFQIIQVPEPSTWAAVAVGVGLLGVVTLRRRRASAV